MKHDELQPLAVGHIDVLYGHIDEGFKFANLASNLLTCVVRHHLTDDLQRLGSNAEDDVAAIPVEHGTQRVHTILQLTRGLL